MRCFATYCFSVTLTANKTQYRVPGRRCEKTIIGKLFGVSNRDKKRARIPCNELARKGYFGASCRRPADTRCFFSPRKFSSFKKLEEGSGRCGNVGRGNVRNGAPVEKIRYERKEEKIERKRETQKRIVRQREREENGEREREKE